MIEVKHLKTLVALEKTGSLVDAADILYMTQSALSHQIKDLEERLSTPLFVRKTKPLKFTVAGERILSLARDVLPMFEQTLMDLERLQSGNAGRLHMAIECHSCFQWLTPAIDQFREICSAVELDFSSGFDYSPLPALKRGTLDLVITSDPQDITGIHYEPLFRYQPMLAISRHHPYAGKPFIEPEDIANQTLITYPVEKERLDIFNLFLMPADIYPAQIRHAEMTVIMLQLVASGRGVAALPNWALTEYLEKGYILAKPLGEESCWTTLYAAVRVEQLEMAYMQSFLDVAKESSFKQLKGIKRINH